MRYLVLILSVISTSSLVLSFPAQPSAPADSDKLIVEATLKQALAEIKAGVEKNDDEKVMAGLVTLKQFPEIAPDGHKLKASALEALAFQVKMQAVRNRSAATPKSVDRDPSGNAVTRSGVLAGRVVKLVKPNAPAIAKIANAHGTVEIGVLIDESGKVEQILSARGHPLLQAAAAAAALATEFAPVRFEGKPIKVNGTISYHF
ncbi:MAG: TonB family protein [Pyrinomonadaceae bacterium]